MTRTDYWNRLVAANPYLGRTDGKLTISPEVFKQQIAKAFDTGEQSGQKTGYTKGFREGKRAGVPDYASAFGDFFDLHTGHNS